LANAMDFLDITPARWQMAGLPLPDNPPENLQI
jgi:hypothetical protein